MASVPPSGTKGNGPRPLTPGSARQAAAFLVEQSHGDPAVALLLLRDVQQGQLKTAQDELARDMASALDKAGALDRPAKGDTAKQSVAIRYFRQVLAQPPELTADQLRRILPGSGSRADVYAPLLSEAMAANGIDTVWRRAAFLAQLGVESYNLHKTEEGLWYISPGRLVNFFPSRIPTIKAAKPFLRKPEALANRAYAGKNGNGDEASGDGWRYRGRGLIQITGRSNYRSAGYEAAPDMVATPHEAVASAAQYWRDHGLNSLSSRELTYAQFYVLVGRVNAGHLQEGDRWSAYKRALQIFQPGKQR